MESSQASPRIIKVKWGGLEIEGLGDFKDAKLYPGGAREWDWNETGTSHTPGVQSGDVEELLEKDVKVVVIGGGMFKRLGISPGTVQMLRDKNIEVHLLPTDKAVKLYNELRGVTRVGALIHTTC